MKTGIIVTGLVAAALVIGGFIIINNKSDNNQTSTTNTTNKQPETATNTSETQTPQSASPITYANSGFTPSSLTVKAGDSVTIKNNSDGSIQIQSKQAKLALSQSLKQARSVTITTSIRLKPAQSLFNKDKNSCTSKYF